MDDVGCGLSVDQDRRRAIVSAGPEASARRTRKPVPSASQVQAGYPDAEHFTIDKPLGRWENE